MFNKKNIYLFNVNKKIIFKKITENHNEPAFQIFYQRVSVCFDSLKIVNFILIFLNGVMLFLEMKTRLNKFVYELLAGRKNSYKRVARQHPKFLNLL